MPGLGVGGGVGSGWGRLWSCMGMRHAAAGGLSATQVLGDEAAGEAPWAAAALLGASWLSATIMELTAAAAFCRGLGTAAARCLGSARGCWLRCGRLAGRCVVAGPCMGCALWLPVVAWDAGRPGLLG